MTLMPNDVTHITPMGNILSDSQIKGYVDELVEKLVIPDDDYSKFRTKKLIEKGKITPNCIKSALEYVRDDPSREKAHPKRYAYLDIFCAATWFEKPKNFEP